MLVSDLITRMLREHSETQDDPGFQNLMLQWINDAVNDLCQETDYKVLKSTTSIVTVVGTAEYNLPVAVREITAMRIDANFKPIEYIPQQELLLSNNNLSIRGTPDFWYYHSTAVVTNESALSIRLFPVPDAVYAITAAILLNPNDLVSASVLPVQRDHINILKHRIRYYMLFDDKDYEGADRADQRFIKGVNEIKGRENKRIAQYRRMQVTDVPSTRHQFVRFDPNHFPRS